MVSAWSEPLPIGVPATDSAGALAPAGTLGLSRGATSFGPRRRTGGEPAVAAAGPAVLDCPAAVHADTALFALLMHSIKPASRPEARRL